MRNLFLFLYIFTAFFGIFFVILIYRKHCFQQRFLEAKIFTVFCLLLILQLSEKLFFLIDTEKIRGAPGFSTIVFYFSYPIIYLYFDSFIKKRKTLPEKWWVHFIIPLILTSLLIRFMTVSDEKLISFALSVGPKKITGSTKGLGILFSVSYLVLMGKRVFEHIKNHMQDEKWESSILWILILFLILVSIQSIQLIFYFYMLYAQSYKGMEALKAFPFSLLFFVMAMAGDHLISRITKAREAFDSPSESSKYGKELLDQSTLDSLYEMVIEELINNSLCLDPDLTLQITARKLSITTRILSQVINRKSGMNFNGFINHHRIERVKNELRKEENRHRNILSIAFENGFKSKSSFNTVFKKFTGKTPSQYLKEIETSSENRS